MLLRRRLALPLNISPRRILYLVYSAIALVLFAYVFQQLPPDPNWEPVYHAAGQAFWRGVNPYSIVGFANPVWSMLVIVPLSLLPSDMGRFLFAAYSLPLYLWNAYRLGSKPLSFFAFALSLPVLTTIRQVNLDALAAFGLLLPPQVGLFFVLLKPQFGAGIAFFWLVESFRAGGWRLTVRTFAPVTVASLAMLAVYGFSPFLTVNAAINGVGNNSLFPYAVPLGLALMYFSIRRRDLRFSIPAGLCFSAYVGLGTYAAPLLALLRHPRLCALFSLALWVVFLANLYLIRR